MKAVRLNPLPELVTDLPCPIPAHGEALVKVSLCGICNTDLELMRGYMDFRGIPGHEFVGVVVEENHQGDAGHTSLLGKRVVGEINAACGECVYCLEGSPTHCQNRTVLGLLGRDGCMAEYLTLPIENIHHVPDTLSDETAVFAEPLAAAFKILDQVDIGKGQRAVVLGDGKLGLLCAMALSTTGAEVVLIGRHESKMAMVKPYGVRTWLSEGKIVRGDYDLVVEATGSSSGLEQAIPLVRPRGSIVLKSTVADNKTIDLTPIVVNEISVLGSRCGRFEPALEALSSGKMDPTPLIEAVYPIDDAVKAFEHAARKGALKVLVKF